MKERWETDSVPGFAAGLTAAPEVRTREQAIAHLASLGDDVSIFDYSTVPAEVIADRMAEKHGYIYPNFRPQ